MPGGNVRYRPKDLLSLTETGFLFDATDGESYTLNRTGVCIVRALLEGADSREVWHKVVEAFEIESGKAERDVDQFLSQLRTLKLVTAITPVDEARAR